MIDTFGNWFEQLEKEREAIESRMERHQNELFVANQRLPHSGTLGVLEYQKALQNYYDSAMTRYERHILWLEGEVGVLRIDLVELVSQRRQETETARLNAPVTVQ